MNLELIVGTTVQVARRYDIVTGVSKSRNRQKLGCLAGRGCDGSNTALESRNALFEDIYRRLSDEQASLVSLYALGRIERRTFIIRL